MNFVKKNGILQKSVFLHITMTVYYYESFNNGVITFHQIHCWWSWTRYGLGNVAKLTTQIKHFIAQYGHMHTISKCLIINHTSW